MLEKELEEASPVIVIPLDVRSCRNTAFHFQMVWNEGLTRGKHVCLIKPEQTKHC